MIKPEEKSKFGPKGRVKILNASITAPEQSGLRIIVNLTNQSGKFASPFELRLSKRWGKVREEYKNWFASQQDFKLGSVKTGTLSSDTWIAHALVSNKDNELSKEAFEKAIKKLGELAVYEKASLHVDSSFLEEYPILSDLLNKYAIDNGVNIYFYQSTTM